MRSKIKTIDDKCINSKVFQIVNEESRIAIVEELLKKKYQVNWIGNKKKLNLNIRNY